jgi:hypothetical protein
MNGEKWNAIYLTFLSDRLRPRACRKVSTWRVKLSA